MNSQEQTQTIPKMSAKLVIKKSWALMAIESEEEEERERMEEEENKLKEQIEIRRKLFAAGKYELEEGEILE